MSAAPVRIELEGRPLERIPCDVVVAGFFADDRPLRGGAARIDWRLCGLLSELVLRERLDGDRSEAVLLPSAGALRAPRALIVGLGGRKKYPLAAAKEAVRSALARCFELGVDRVALSPLGIASDDVPRHAGALVEGLFEAAAGYDRGLEVVLAIPSREHDAVAAAFERALRSLDAASVRLGRAGRPTSGSRPAPRGQAAPTP